MNWAKLSTSLFGLVYKRLNNNQCYVCHSKHNDTLCHYCKLGFEHNQIACHVCQLPLQQDNRICGQCQIAPPPYHRCLAPLRFEGITKALIHSIKFHQQAHYIRPLIEILSEHLLATYKESPWPTQLLYVPSHPKRIKERGFCHTQLIAQQLIQRLRQQNNHLDIELTTPNSLIKHRHTQAQHKLNKTLRSKNQMEAYQVQGQLHEHIALLDDVMTTGNTVESCTKVLLKHGAKHVDIWTIARTPDDKHHPHH